MLRVPEPNAPPEGWRDFWQHTKRAYDTQTDLLRDILKHLEALLKYQARRDPTRRVLNLNAQPTRIDTLGYRRVRLWLAASTPVLVNMLGAPTSVTLGPGWVVLDCPDGTELTTAAATLAILELSDVTV